MRIDTRCFTYEDAVYERLVHPVRKIPHPQCFCAGFRRHVRHDRSPWPLTPFLGGVLVRGRALTGEDGGVHSSSECTALRAPRSCLSFGMGAASVLVCASRQNRACANCVNVFRSNPHKDTSPGPAILYCQNTAISITACSAPPAPLCPAWTLCLP